MSRAASAIVLLAASWLVAACSQTQQQNWIGDQELPETRAELYRQYGVPDVIRVQGEDRWLRYDSSRSKGMTLGARWWGLGLLIGRSHSEADRVWVRVDPDDRITAVEADRNSDRLRYQLWPFGD